MALVARLFGSKAELWQAVVDHLAARQAEHRVQFLRILDCKDSDPANAIRQFIEIFVAISWEMPEFTAFFIQEATNPGERLDILIEEVIRPFTTLCLPIIEASVSAGVVNARDPALFLQMLFAAISLPMVSPSLREPDSVEGKSRREAIAREAIAMFVVAK